MARADTWAIHCIVTAALWLATTTGAFSRQVVDLYDPFRELNDTVWRLAENSASKSTLPDLAVHFSPQSIDLTTNCYEIILAFEGADRKLRFSNTAGSSTSTAKKCEATKSAFNVFAAKAEKVRSYARIANRLVLRDEKNAPIAEFEPIAPDGIEYRRLKVLSYRDGTRMVEAKSLGNAEPNLFLFNGRIDGSPGCGGFAGSSYRHRDDSTFVISTFWVLAGHCDNIDAAVRQNNAISRNLDGIRRVSETSDGRFELRDTSGSVRIVLVRCRVELNASGGEHLSC